MVPLYTPLPFLNNFALVLLLFSLSLVHDSLYSLSFCFFQLPQSLRSLLKLDKSLRLLKWNGIIILITFHTTHTHYFQSHCIPERSHRNDISWK